MNLQLIAIKQWGQAALVSAAGVLGISLFLGMSDPAPASAALVAPESVRLISEQNLQTVSPQAGKNGNSKEWGRRGRLASTLR